MFSKIKVCKSIFIPGVGNNIIFFIILLYYYFFIIANPDFNGFTTTAKAFSVKPKV